MAQSGLRHSPAARGADPNPQGDVIVASSSNGRGDSSDGRDRRSSLAACGGGGSYKAEGKRRARPHTAGPPTAPLTGLPVTGNLPVRPALEVKIANNVEARPQTGLDVADVVYEELVEGCVHAPARDLPLPASGFCRADPLGAVHRPRRRVAARRSLRVLGWGAGPAGRDPSGAGAARRREQRRRRDVPRQVQEHDRAHRSTLYGHPPAMLAGGADEPTRPRCSATSVRARRSPATPSSPYRSRCRLDASVRPTYTWTTPRRSRGSAASTAGRPRRSTASRSRRPTWCVQFTNYPAPADGRRA